MINYFFQKKYLANSIDTSIVFYTGYAAMKNNDPINAAYYFQKLADNNCSGVDLQIAYGWLSNYLLNTKKETVNAKAVCNKGLTFYPNDDYLKDVSMQITRSSGNANDLFAKHEQLIAAPKAGYSEYIAYAAELYDYLYVDNISTIGSKTQYQNKMKQMLDKAFTIKPKAFPVNYIYGMYFTQLALETQETIKKIAASDTEQKNKLNDSSKQYAQQAMGYLETTCTIYETSASLISSQKENYKTALLQLKNLYRYLQLTDKLSAVEPKLKALK